MACPELLGSDTSRFPDTLPWTTCFSLIANDVIATSSIISVIIIIITFTLSNCMHACVFHLKKSNLFKQLSNWDFWWHRNSNNYLQHVWIHTALNKREWAHPQIIPSGRVSTCCSSHMNSINLHVNRGLHASVELKAVFQHFTVELGSGHITTWWFNLVVMCQLKSF